MANYSSTYRIGVTADTSQFMRSINEAFQRLKEVAKSTELKEGVQEAAKAAYELQQALSSSMDWKNQRLDLTAFNEQLKKSGKSIQDYGTQMAKAGTDGRSAFASVASAIVSAEMPLKRTNKLMDELWTTMKNTMRWQVTSSVLNTFTGALQTAYGYSKDLDNSLNNIRIVTSKSAEDMKDFARQANNAAKALSTTTTEYTDAALIYYQQGLTDEAVQGRTDATIKLANVTGQDVTTTSEQLTAIWNNFYDGSRSLEYYVDVMAKLGAATASSSDEIAEGVQKFASVADTVGLSYEYAASALATLTASTRESASVVGTSLRTLFSRLQGLTLGETLEDGVDLNKYSEALHKVGVEVLDANGNMRDMDTILDDTAERWDKLTNAQQTALAQTVAGVRQYTTFINLMENWQDFETNLATAKGSEGTLTIQAEIYSQSWEGARDRVRAAAEDIYDSLINPDFYIALDNYLEPLLSFFADAIDGAGGLAGILSTIVTLLSKVYSDKIAKTMEDMVANISSLETSDQRQARKIKQNAAAAAKTNYTEAKREYQKSGIVDRGSVSNAIDRLEVEKEIADTEEKLADKASELTERQTEQLQGQIQLLKQQLEQIERWEASANAAASASNNAVQRIVGSGAANENTWRSALLGQEEETQVKTRDYVQALEAKSREKGENGEEKISNNAQAINFLTECMYDNILAREKYMRIQEKYKSLQKDETKDTEAVAEAIKAYAEELDYELNNLDGSNEGLLKYLDKREKNTLDNYEKILQELRDLIAKIQGVDLEGDSGLEESLQELEGQLTKEANQMIVFKNETKKAGKAAQGLKQDLQDGKAGLLDWSEEFTRTTTAISGVVAVSQSLRSVLGSLNDADLSWSDKLSQSMGALMTIIPTAMTALKAYKELQDNINAKLEEVGNTQGEVNAQVAASAMASQIAEVAAKKSADGYTLLGGALQFVSGTIAGIELQLPTLLAIGAAVSVAVAVAQGLSDIIENNHEQEIESRQKIYEAEKEEIEQQQSLIDAYEEAYKTYQETGEGKEALVKAANALITTENKEAVAVANLTGNYKELNAEIEKNKKKQAESAAANITTGLAIQGEKLKDSMTGGKGYINSLTGMYNISLGSAGTSDVVRNSDFYQKYYNGENTFAFSSDPIEMAQAITSARELVAEMQEAGETSSSFYKNTVAWITENDEAYTNFMASQEEAVQANFQKETLKAGSTDDIKSLEDYEAWMARLNDSIRENSTLNKLSEEELDALRASYISATPAIREYALQSQLLSSLSKKFNIDFEGNEDIKKALISSMDDLDEDALSVAVSLVADSKSLEDFSNKFSQQITKSIVESTVKSFEIVGGILQDVNSGHEFSDDDYKALQGDTVFMSEVEGDFGSFEKFQQQSFDKRVEYVRDYYDTINKEAANSLSLLAEQTQQELIIVGQKKIAIESLTENQLLTMARIRAEYNEAIENGDEETARKAEATWKSFQTLLSFEGVDLSLFEIGDTEDSLDALTNKFDEIQERIEDIAKQKIDIAIEWDDLDDLKTQMDSLGDFATIMQDEGKKVGDSYQYSIDEIRDWADVYPELFKQARVTADGLMEIDQEVVDKFIEGKKKQVDKNAEAKIEIWELDLEDLKQTKTNLEAEQTALTNAANGKIDIATLENEQKASLVQQYTQYQIDKGVEETEAHANALNVMSLDEEEYSEIVAEVAQKNSDNMTDSANESATNTTKSISKMSAAAQSFGHNVLEVAKVVGAWMKGEEYTPDWTHVEDYVEEKNEFTGSSIEKEFEGAEGKEVDPIEDFRDERLKEIGIDLDAIDNAIANLETKIRMAEGIRSIKDVSQGTGKTTSESSSEATIETLEEALERYHEITREIEYQERELDKLKNKIDKTYGVEKLKAYNEELVTLSKLAELQGQKASVALAFVASDAQVLREDLGLDIQVDEEFLEITNYTELLRQAQQELENFYTYYNNLSKEGQEAAEAEKEAAEKRYEDIKTALDNYEDSVDTYREEIDEMEETLSSIEDTKLLKITYALEIELDVKDMKASLNKLSKSILETFDNTLETQKARIELGYSDVMLDVGLHSKYEETWESLQQRLSEATTETDKQAIQDAIQDLFSEVEGSAEALIEWANSIEDIVPEAISTAAEEFAKFINELDRNVSVLEAIKELQTLQSVTAKTDAGLATLQKNLQARLDTQSAQAVLQKQWADDFENRYTQAQAELDTYLANGGSTASNEYDRLVNMVNAYKEQWQEAEDAYLSLAKEAMETAQEMYLNELENAKEAFANALTDGLGLDYLQSKYDNLIEEEERYLDTVNEAYEKASWYNKLQQDIDDATNEAYVKKLKALQDEINYRKESGKLSEYDLEILEAKYNVLQAQMALEDARNAKNNLQLVRDSQGNWNYQYTADQDQIANAEQDLMDAQNEWYNLAKDRVTEVTGDIVAMWQECQDEIDQIYQDLLSGDITQEQYLAKVEEIERYYTEKSLYLEQEKQQAIADMNEAGFESLKTTLADSGTEIDNFQSEYANQLASMTAENASFEDKLSEYLGKCQASYQGYQDKVDKVAQETGLTQDALAEKTNKVVKATENLYEKGKDVVPVLWKQVDVAQELSDRYGQNGLAGAIWKAIEAYRIMMQEMNQQTASSTGASLDHSVDYSALMADAEYGSAEYNEYKSARETIEASGYDVGAATTDRVDAFLKKGYKLSDYGYNYFTQIPEELWDKLVGLDTGGYTGEFDNGRLALLHEKELVLNQEDTANILAAVGAVRSLGPEFFAAIEKALDGSVAASFGLMNDRLNTSSIQPIADTLEQDVHIEAVFPNVTSRSEIEEAFSNLTNDASQFIRRRKE